MLTGRKGQSATAVLLNKANLQLKGERVKADSEKDDLQVYIDSLTNKTSKQGKSISFDADSDISISNEDRYVASPVAAPTVNRFIKKKTPAVTFGENKSHGNKPQENKAVATSRSYENFIKSDQMQSGQTAARPTNVSGKVSPKKQNSVTPFSSVSLSSDMESETSVREGRGHRRSVRPATVQSLSAMSDDCEKIGNDGGKFLKGKVNREHDIKRNERENNVTAESPTKPRKPSATFALSSDEESLANFINHLSDSASHDVEPANRHRSPSPISYSSVDDFKGNVLLDLSSLGPVTAVDEVDNNNTKRAVAPAASPFYKKNHAVNDSAFESVVETKQPSGILQASTKSPFYKKASGDSNENVIYNKQPSQVLHSQGNSPFYKNVKPDDLKDNEYDGKQSKNLFYTKSKSPFAANNAMSDLKDRTKTHRKTDTRSNDVFSAFGLQTVEDLIGGDSDSEAGLVEGDRAMRAAPLDDSVCGLPSVPTKADNSGRGTSYTEDFEESITERIGDIRSEAVRSRSISDADESTREHSSDTEGSDSESSQSSAPVSRVVASHTKVTVETRAIEVQTDSQTGLRDPRLPQSTASTRRGLGTMDSIPIAPHVVSADTIEALTAYTPATIALHNMLKDQVQLTTQFLAAQQALYTAYTRHDSDHTYRYTTLDDTKQYIEAHRKPRLTFEEALRRVAGENV